MTQEENVYHKIRHYFNLEYDERNKEAVVKMLNEYRSEIIIQQTVIARAVRKAPPRKIRTVEQRKKQRRFLREKAKRICKRYKITLAELKINSPIEVYRDSKRKNRCYGEPRKAFCVACRIKGIPYVDIADFLGHRDHGGARYYVKDLSTFTRAVLNQKENADASLKNVA